MATFVRVHTVIVVDPMELLLVKKGILRTLGKVLLCLVDKISIRV
jgi:hypothetical protein